MQYLKPIVLSSFLMIALSLKVEFFMHLAHERTFKYMEILVFINLPIYSIFVIIVLSVLFFQCLFLLGQRIVALDRW